jgi:predicted transposase/invertase (TIGR01784 family)
MIEKSKIDATNDVMFKIILGDPRHEHLLIHFLNHAIEPKEPIVSVKIINSELTPEYLGQKGARLDIKAEAKDGELINIEVQRQPDKDMVARNLFYWSKMFSGQILVGEEYHKLQRTICITILDFRLFGDERFCRKGHICDDETKEIMTDLLEMQFLELDKLNKVDEEAPITFWVEFFKDPYSEAVRALCDYVPEIKEAKEIFEKAKSDPEVRALIEAREKSIHDYMNDILCAKSEGKAEEKREMALNAVAMGLSTEQIVKLTGLSPEEIESLKDKR